jgi:hypothetical protein
MEEKVKEMVNIKESSENQITNYLGLSNGTQASQRHICTQN